MNNKETTNNFGFESEQATESKSNRLDKTPALVELSNTRATEIIKRALSDSNIGTLANAATSGSYSECEELVKAVIDEETLLKDSELLADCDNDTFSSLLESRRSSRSKAKAKNPKSDINVCRTYLSSAYSEMLIRLAWQKPYETNSSTLDESDRDAIGRKVKSLQSKKCRLQKTAQYVPSDAKELDAVNEEIDRLNKLRGVSFSSTTVIKSSDMEKLRDALSNMSEDERKTYVEMFKDLLA